MEAGNRCFDQRVPEEINRKIVDHTADINHVQFNCARYLLGGITTGSDYQNGQSNERGACILLPENTMDILTKLGVQPKEYSCLRTP